MSLWYLATPYTRQPNKMAAFHDAAYAAAILMSAGVNVFSPIAHGHQISTFMPDRWHEWWMDINLPHMRNSAGLIVVKMNGLDSSNGIADEIKTFEKMEKPIHYLDWPIDGRAVKSLAYILLGENYWATS